MSQVRAAECARSGRQNGPACVVRIPLSRSLRAQICTMHLSGAVYAETFVAEAIRQGLCVVPVDAGKPASPIGNDAVPIRRLPPARPVARALCPLPPRSPSQALYDNLVDSFRCVPTSRSRGSTVTTSSSRPLPASVALRNHGRVARRRLPPGQLRRMNNTWRSCRPQGFSNAARLGSQIGSAVQRRTSPQTLATLRTQLLAGGLRDEVAVDEKEFADAR